MLANSQTVRARLARHWGVDAEVLYPPHGANLITAPEPIPGLEPGYLLAVSRLVPHKRLEVLTEAMEHLPDQRLVVVGSGPLARALRQGAPANCIFLERVSDAQLAWLYANGVALLSAAHEDLGLAALEAMAYGTPVAVRHAGGFLETVVEGETGLFFERPEPTEVVRAVRGLLGHSFDRELIAKHAQRFDEASFAEALHRFAEVALA